MSNSAVAFLPIRVKIANSPPGCWERKYIENASVQDNPDISFLVVLINFIVQPLDGFFRFLTVALDAEFIVSS